MKKQCYQLCAEINGSCFCKDFNKDPCGTITDMFNQNWTVEDELSYIEEKRRSDKDNPNRP